MDPVKRDNPLSIVWKRLTSLPTSYLLMGIIAVAFMVRTYVWYYSNWVGLVRHGDGYLFMAQALAEGDWDKYFSHWRFLQPIYPIYLTPMFFFNWDDSTYVFWLHQSFVAGTIVFLYLSARRLFGQRCGLVTCLIYALHLQIAYWINWTLADTAFHFHLSLFMFFTISSWERITFYSVIGCLVSGMALVLTRPDGAVIMASTVAVLVFKLLTLRYRPLYALTTVILISILVVVSGLWFVFAHEPIRERVLSNVHVGWGLYTGTLPTPTNPAAVDKGLIAVFRDGSLLSKNDPKGRNQWYWASQIGLKRIKEEPWKVLRFVVTRYIAVVIPSTFRDNPSWRYVIIDRTLSFYLIIGVLGAIFLRNEKRFYSIGLTVIAFSIYTLVCIYQREWDIRVQLSSYTVLLGASTFGWFLALTRLFWRGGLVLSEGTPSGLNRIPDVLSAEPDRQVVMKGEVSK
ncbi:MAG: glycosyltransferase family 39 protein [Syntrophales bacterium LBB04]|nr:glycosyltransferase family 39 protein [Syntrophales bacterium LBB04]